MVCFWLARPTRALSDCGPRLATIEGADQRPRGGVPHFVGLVSARQYATAVGRERNRERCDGVPKRQHDLYLRRILCAQGSDKRQQHHERNENDLSSPEQRSFPLPGTKSVPHITGRKSAVLETFEARCANVPRGVLASNFASDLRSARHQCAGQRYA